MNKNKLIVIFSILVVLLVWILIYSSKNKQNQEIENNLPKSEIFTLLDEEDKVIFNEEKNLSADEIKIYQERIDEAEKNLDNRFNEEENKGMDKNEFMVANLNNLALHYGYFGDYEKSYDYYLEALKWDEKDRLTWLSFGDLLLKMRAYKSAENAYKKAIELNPYAPLNYIKLADLYKKDGGDKQRVYDTYEEAIEKVALDSQLWGFYAEWLEKEGQYEEAIEKYEKLKEKQPENKEVVDKKIEKIKDKIE